MLRKQKQIIGLPFAIKIVYSGDIRLTVICLSVAKIFEIYKLLLRIAPATTKFI